MHRSQIVSTQDLSRSKLVIYPQQATISDYADYVTFSNLDCDSWCLKQDCHKIISYREWIDGQGYCNKHAVELGKIW